MAIDQSGNNGVGAPTKQTLVTNYLDFTTGDDGWAKQYLPDLMDKEAEVFGNRTIGGFLEMVGAEEASASDQVLWTEQGRLHLRYEGALKANTAADGSEDSADGIVDGLGTDHGLRVGDTVIVSSNAKGSSIPCYVSSIFGDDSGNVVDVTLLSGEVLLVPYVGTDLGTSLGWANEAGADDPLSIFVYGSEYTKGTTGRTEAIQPAHKTFKNKMVILKDMYEVSGSDASQIGWVEVSGEDGQNGYLWYLKASGDTRTRFADYCEMAMLESKMATNADLKTGKIAGSEGLFSAVQSRGILSDGILGSAASAANLTAFDLILKEFDKQGAIEEYMMFVNRDTSLAIDDMLGDVNSSAGSSFGVFNNEEDMAINLGFHGFRRGSYDFYKSDWKYLNDSQTRGGFGMGDPGSETSNADQIRGMFVPAGVTSVYDQQLGKNLKRPFLHVRYRASQTENRKFKTWTTGSVGAVTSDLDAMQMHFLSERCLVVQGANNFCQIATST